MPRFGFKSSSGSSKVSARDLDQQSKASKQDGKSKQSSKNSRRRNFGFLGVGRTEKQKDKTVISKRREHAKQLANLAYSDDPTTATSTSTNDSAYNMNTTIISPANNNKKSNTSFFDQRPPRQVQSRPRTGSNKSSSTSNSSTVNDAFGSDPFANFDAFGSSAPVPKKPVTKKPATKKPSKFSAEDFSELDFFAGQMAGATTPVYQSKENNQQSKKSTRRGNGPISLDHFFDEDDASCDLSTIDNGGASINSNVAARRRLRSQMQSTTNDNASVGSSKLARSRSTPQIPPISPGVPKKRSLSQKFGNANFPDQRQSSGSVTSSTANYSSSSPGGANLFESGNDAGFTFDAFGLDESQVGRDVSSAMKDIMGDGGFSFFDDADVSGSVSGSNSESGHGSGNNSAGSSRNNSFTRQDSGHYTDGDSETSFEVQKWDSSPTTSRGPSPVPRASPATPQKSPVKLSSVQQRRLQRSVQRGGTAASAVTPQRVNSNNRQIASEPPAKTKSSSQFGAFPDDPFDEDPFASSDDGGRFSDMFANDGSNTSRKLYAEAQSDVHDYYAKGSLNVAANSLLNSSTPKNGTPSSGGRKKRLYARSDIGVSAPERLSFEPPLFDLPPSESGNQSDGQSDDMEQMHDDVTHEVAKDIVKRISPTNRSKVNNDARSQAIRKFRHGDERIDESDSDDQGAKPTKPQHTQPANKSSTPSSSRFGSFRDRYERSRSLSRTNTPVNSNAKNDLGRSSYHGPSPSHSAQQAESKPIPKWQQSRQAPIEEKKEDDVVARPPMNSLKARWEAKTRPSAASNPVKTAPPKPTEQSEQTRKSINNMDNTFEMLTPDIIEQRRQLAKKEKFNNLRKSMGVEESPEKSKSDDPLGNMVLDNVKPRSPPKRSSRNADARSDIGYSPSYLTKVTLEKVASPETFSPVASPVGQKMTYRERREMELKAQRDEEDAKKASAPQPVQKTMNYRERREMELKLQNKMEAKPPTQNSASPDVASLIRKRINANKKKDSPPLESNQFSSNSPRSFHATRNTAVHTNEAEETPPQNPSKMLENMFAPRAPPVIKKPAPAKPSSTARPPHQMLDSFLSSKVQSAKPKQTEKPVASKPKSNLMDIPDDVSQVDAKSVLSGFLTKKSAPPMPVPTYLGDEDSEEEEKAAPSAAEPSGNASGPALKDDPRFERYFRMLKMGLPLEVAKHAMVRDELDPSILDMDHNKPLCLGTPLKDDPKFAKYFKMLKIGLPIDHVKHAMARDGLDPSVMDQDHNLPAKTTEKKKEKKKKETHRRARLHWKSLGKIMKNSLWDTVQSEVGGISIDEDEFEDLFQAELKASNVIKTPSSESKKKGAQVRVIDTKRANNGGIILARVKLTHDQMATAVDRIDASTLTAEQIENVIEYLPTKEERDALEKYMMQGGQDAAQKFDGLCECEKFMVSMMTVKHAKRKIRALLFKLQFMTCMDSIAKDVEMIDQACDELMNSNRLRQLLGIILEFGNRLNTAGSSSKSKAGGFSLESLSKLSQAKAFDKKTTFLHYIILIVERNNELLLKYYDDIPTALASDNIFWDQCQQDLEEVENQLENVRKMALYEARAKHDPRANKKVSDDDSIGELEMTLEEEVSSLRASKTGLFTLGAIKKVSAMREKMDRTRAKCVRLNQYFGVASKTIEPQEIFSVFATFTSDFKKAKEQVFSKASKRLREERKKLRKNTPKKKKPVSAPEPASRAPRMRASSHQPNMNALFGDIKNRQSSNGPPKVDPRAGLLSSIKERQSPSSSSSPMDPRAGLMASIQKRQPANSAPANPRAAMMDAIKKRQPAPAPSANPRAAMMDAIKQRQSAPAPANPRAAMMDAIKQRQSAPAPANPRAAMMDAIKQRQSAPTPANPRAAMMDAIKQRQQPAPENSRMSLLSSIKARNPDNDGAENNKAPADSRMSLLSSIKARNPDNVQENKPPVDSRMSLLSSIKARNPDNASPEKSSFVTERSRPVLNRR